jgi:hypothetical protein
MKRRMVSRRRTIGHGGLRVTNPPGMPSSAPARSPAAFKHHGVTAFRFLQALAARARATERSPGP